MRCERKKDIELYCDIYTPGEVPEYYFDRYKMTTLIAKDKFFYSRLLRVFFVFVETGKDSVTFWTFTGTFQQIFLQ
jgi:hypothetical protein